MCGIQSGDSTLLLDKEWPKSSGRGDNVSNSNRRDSKLMAKITRADQHPVNTIFDVLIGTHTHTVDVRNEVLGSLGVAEIKSLVKDMAMKQHDGEQSKSLDELVEE